jgi:hypothetical protein
MKAFERSQTTDSLVRYLAQHEKEALIDYKELTQIAGITVTPRTTNLTSARKILERDHAQVWICVAPAVALYRLNDAEIAARQRDWYLNGARNKLSAGARQADVVELEGLDLKQQARFATDSIVREIARDALARATHRQIEKVARGTSNDLPAFNAVEWMISLSPRRAAK